jgi:hypothetical protein
LVHPDVVDHVRQLVEAAAAYERATPRSPLDGKRWYYANNLSPAVPEGLGDEDAIRAIWAAESGRS